MGFPTQEQDIINLLKQGNQQGMTLLYSNYSGALYGIIFRMVREEELAKEILQDVLLRIWKYISKYNPEKGRFYTWMAQIARNCCLNQINSAKYQRAKQTDSLDPEVHSNERLTENPTVKDSGLSDVISKMDPEHRILIDYLYFKGYSQSETAKELDIPIGTVKTRIRKAILHLRKVLGNDIAVISLLLALMLERIL